MENLLGSVEHFVNLFTKVYEVDLPLDSHVGKKSKHEIIPSLTLLCKAGVKIEAEPAKSIFDIRFNWTKGVLKIPPFWLGTEFEVIRNVVAYEQCHYSGDCYMSDYAYFMGNLVKTPRDLELLVESKVLLEDKMLSEGLEKYASSVINDATGLIVNDDKFFYADICEELEEYCRNPWSRWNAVLRQKHFNTPWVVIFVIAAALLLTLTLTQTISSIVLH
ncbi:UPF0481 protein [Prunus yedoensis var. nudiflora]|uniref:UPF0481 protein n=1 Tax=Prunus yedoensis var. nudiflora TaxID=2094558 RepID=A0A314UF96_PRUYE|nr:UPF0481 protein [Prunus yedoensis var. nudiflora]